MVFNDLLVVLKRKLLNILSDMQPQSKFQLNALLDLKQPALLGTFCLLTATTIILFSN